jgi:hypothetical protein
MSILAIGAGRSGIPVLERGKKPRLLRVTGTFLSAGHLAWQIFRTVGCGQMIEAWRRFFGIMISVCYNSVEFLFYLAAALIPTGEYTGENLPRLQ